jgi:TRAP-type C4-dicarboxylate transport system substrate-binding protein
MAATGVRLGTTVAGLLALVAAAGCSGSTDKAGGKKDSPVRVLSVLNPRGPGEVQPFGEKVAELSGGNLRLQIQSGWEKGSISSEADAIHTVQSGAADLAIVPARAWHSVGVTSFDALIAPLEIDSMTLQQKVLSSDIATDMLDGVKRVGLEGIGMLPGPMRKPAGITRALSAPTDYVGARIGFSPSAIADRSLRALGAVPVESGFDGASISADDGIEQQVSSISANRYDRAVTTITVNVNLWPRPMVIVAGAKVFASLTGAQRSWLRSSARDVLDATTKVQMAFDTEDLGSMCRRGKVKLVSASSVQLVQLRAAFAPVYEWLRQDAATARYLDEIAALRADSAVPYQLEALSCAGITTGPRPPASAATGTATAPSRLDGVYEVTLSEADLRAAGDAIGPANEGLFRFVFERGRFAFTQHFEPTCTWGYGTFTVTGDRLRLSFIDGGGIASGGAVNRPGEVFDYHWSIYRNAMRWSAVPSAVSPAGWAFKPWLVVSKTASIRYLDQHCLPPAGALSG